MGNEGKQVTLQPENKIIANILQINSSSPRVNPIYPALINRMLLHILRRLFIDCAVIVCIYNFGDPHDMHVVFSLAEKISVMAQGAIIAEGAPDAIKNDPREQEASLGGAHL